MSVLRAGLVAGLAATAGLTVILSGCGDVDLRWALPTADELAMADSGPGQRRTPDTASLWRGRIVAVTECVGCHRMYRPGEYTPGQWGALARRMGKRASLSRQQIADLEAYLAEASRYVRAREHPQE